MTYDVTFNGDAYFTFDKEDTALHKHINSQFTQTGFCFVNAIAINLVTHEMKAECVFDWSVEYYEYKNDIIRDLLINKLKDMNNA